MALSNLEVEVEIEQRDKGGFVHTVVRPDQNLTEREVKILFNSARRCEVSRFLKGPINLEYELRRTG